MGRVRIFPGTVPALTPLDFAPDIWYRSDSVVLAGADVDVLTDKSGNGVHGVTTVGQRPFYNTSGTLPKLVFDAAANEHVNWPCLGPPAAVTFVLVAAITVAAGTRQVVHTHQDLGGSQGMNLVASSPNLQIEQYGGGAALNTGVLSAALMQRDVQWTGTVKRYRENAGAWVSNAAPALDTAGATLGSLAAYYNGVQATSMDFYEFAYWQRELSATELAKIRTYVLRHYASVLP